MIKLKKEVLRLNRSGATTTYTENMLHKSFDPRMKERREKERRLSMLAVSIQPGTGLF